MYAIGINIATAAIFIIIRMQSLFAFENIVCGGLGWYYLVSKK